MVPKTTPPPTLDSLQHQRPARKTPPRVLDADEDVETQAAPDISKDDPPSDEIVAKILAKYHSFGTDDADANLARLRELVEDCLDPNSNPCLICIDDINKRWVKDGVVRTNGLTPELFPEAEIPWFCPKCHTNYSRKEAPRVYRCFCTKEVEPRFDPWLTPHSCGEACDRLLSCGQHRCLMLCHPGKCLKCPRLLPDTPCFCGRQRTSRRCGNVAYSCGERCGQKLPCGHACELTCHEGPCPPCPRRSQRACRCGRVVADQPCAKLEWSCETVCGQPLACGFHRCEVTCHSGPCAPCAGQLQRACPCGKSTYPDLPCTETVPTCGSTCDRMLACGEHRCVRQCHYGDCGACMQTQQVSCRCGAQTKELACGTSLTCTRKCGRILPCGHPCKRKCCDVCPPCERVCGKRLQCNQHTCQDPCHAGPCYPCSQTMTRSCACGASTVTVPCGRDASRRKPRCREPCRVPPYCRHPTQRPHTCHDGNCPQCRQTCATELSCGHACQAPCHDKRPRREEIELTKTERKKQKLKSNPVREIKQLTPCPPCQVPVPRACKGAHTVRDLPCAANAPFGCDQTCDRLLACTRHRCAQPCHLPLRAGTSWHEQDLLLRRELGATSVPVALDSLAYATCEPLLRAHMASPSDGGMASGEGAELSGLTAGCGACPRRCELPRPPGCPHTCAREWCHPGLCPPCKHIISHPCHCEALVLALDCDEWTRKLPGDRDALLSCHHRCPRLLSCGHQCTKDCHPGACSPASSCTKLVSLRCPCKRRKERIPCQRVQAEQLEHVACDAACRERQAASAAEEAQRIEAEEAAQRAKDQAELEAFRNRGRRRRKRPSRAEESEAPEVAPPWYQEPRKLAIVATLFVIAATGLGVLLF
ncbi:uncharacterized protein MONBRDRAFT_37362 [Monosiga brevicollis MX1]|uniref:NF-X1-type domain-containing protein n=1 Tax=Monosiga brevicollis TaxID=81824 RepID=A9V186_MONBE|nr:uncharacterized protein MONBRDRAFT_37362 [Monosiga brevicollis MX1]EDQ88887.1 predicted protein [Monosiga brevicollis MX1]|eukprot:XP_001746500.1 hypothetical protein [Monosiga brevicollis MX1]